MINWNNLDTAHSFKELSEVARVNLAEAMTGEKGAERVKKYNSPMACGLTFNYAAKQVDDSVLEALAKLAKETELIEKFAALYNGEVVNTGEKRLVLHHMTRGQLGDAVTADGCDKRTFYVEQQDKIAEFANKVHAGDITNAAGEKFTTVVQIGIGGSDLGPRAMYLALENWAKVNNTFKMEAKFISNVDPDDAAAVLNTIDVEHSIFVLVSKSGTTLETLTNESFVKDALKNAGLDPSKHMIAVTSETSPLAKSDDYLAAFFMDDYIGGRFSSTSAVGGAVLSLAFGPEVFAEILNGAAENDKLSKNEYPKECIDIAVEYVKSYNYIDDDRYAHNFVRLSQERLSRQQIFQKLMQRGIRKDLINSALDDEYESDEDEMIRKLLEKRHFKGQLSEDKEFQRIYNYILRRGYSSNKILKEMRNYTC